MTIKVQLFEGFHDIDLSVSHPGKVLVGVRAAALIIGECEGFEAGRDWLLEYRGKRDRKEVVEALGAVRLAIDMRLDALEEQLIWRPRAVIRNKWFTYNSRPVPTPGES